MKQPNKKIEPVCDNCGQCCASYSFWMSNRSFDNDPKEIKQLIQYHRCESIKNAKGELGIRIPIMCVHLVVKNGKSKCVIHAKKPVVCKEYFCERIIKRALEKQIEDGVLV